MVVPETLDVVLLLIASLIVIIIFILTIVQNFRRQPTIIGRTAIILLIIGLLFLSLLIFRRQELEAADWAQALLMIGLVLITALYASSAEKQADASVKMADGMARPVIDFKRDTAKIDINRQTLEVNAALTKDVSHGLSCILCNVGVGSAIDVRSFIQHPERGRLPFEFGTIESRGKTERWILSISHESNRIALVACYEDIYGRTLKSSREVLVQNRSIELGPLHIIVNGERTKND